MNTASNIKKIIIVLHKLYNSFLEDKREFLNDPKILEYLFNRAPFKTDDYTRAIKMSDPDFDPVRLNRIQKSEIESKYMTMLKSLEQYQLIYRKRTKLIFIQTLKKMR
jgi:hypothetical protein